MKLRKFEDLTEEEKREVCILHWVGKKASLIKRMFNLSPTVAIPLECIRWIKKEAERIERKRLGVEHE